MQNGIAGGTDGVISVVSARLVLQAKSIRNKDRVIAELVDAGVWTWIDETTLQQDWTGQETAADQALKLTANAQRQADWVTRNRRCAAGDHSMCAGTKRRCQKKNNGVTNGTHSTTTPHHPTTKPDPTGLGEGSQSESSDGPAQAPPGQRSIAGATTLPGPSSEGETGASNNRAIEIDIFSDSPELVEALERLQKLEVG